MLRRLLPVLFLPMLLVPPTTPAMAQTGAEDDRASSMNCSHEADHGSATARFVPGTADTNSAMTFAAVRPVSGGAVHVAVCRAELRVAASPDANAHVTISLKKPLPAGMLAASLVRRMDVADGKLEIEIEAPEGFSPAVAVLVPMGAALELAMVRGNVDVLKLTGDAKVAIVKGTVTLHLADSDFGTIECATVMGGIRDRREHGTGSHGHVLGTWTGHGTGKAKVELSAVSGDLVLLPPMRPGGATGGAEAR